MWNFHFFNRSQCLHRETDLNVWKLQSQTYQWCQTFGKHSLLSVSNSQHMLAIPKSLPLCGRAPSFRGSHDTVWWFASTDLHMLSLPWCSQFFCFYYFFQYSNFPLCSDVPKYIVYTRMNISVWSPWSLIKTKTKTKTRTKIKKKKKNPHNSCFLRTHLSL